MKTKPVITNPAAEWAALTNRQMETAASRALCETKRLILKKLYGRLRPSNPFQGLPS